MDHKNNRFIKIKKGMGKSFSIISDRRLKCPCCFISAHVEHGGFKTYMTTIFPTWEPRK
jgi:hypothetical protein